MKKAIAMLMLMAFTALPVADIVMPPPHVEAGYALFAKKKAELEAQLNKAQRKGDKREEERIKKELEKLKKAEQDAAVDRATPKFNGIG